MTEHLERIKHRKTALLNSQSACEKRKQSTCKEMNKPHEQQQRTAQNVDGFGGFKKGFLFDSKSHKKTVGSATDLSNAKTEPFHEEDSATGRGLSTKEDDIIRPKNQDSKSSNLEFPEVQEAMKASYPFLNTESKSQMQKIIVINK